MVIIPTEKRFDWSHAPVVLCLIVIINVVVFVFYQSGDSNKYEEAISLYEQKELVFQEWPHFKEFLSSRQETQLLEESESLHRAELFEELSVQILFTEGFYNYLLENKKNQLNHYSELKWESDRAAVSRIIESVSSHSYGLIPNELKPITLITHQFLHGGLLHIVGNLFFLVICGFAVEAAIGHIRFLLFYILGGVAGGAFHMLFDMSSGTPLIGASGAISGVMAMYLGVFRFKKIEFFYWLFIFVGYFRAPALFILPLYVGKEVYSYASEPNSNVAFMAHTGGFIGGAVLMLISSLIDSKTRNEEYIDEDQESNPHQERLAKIYSNIGACKFETALVFLDALIEDTQATFDLTMLRYHLLKLKKGEAYSECVQNILQQDKLLPHELSKVETVWKENIQATMSMDDEKIVMLGMRLSGLPNVDTSEKIFAQAFKKNNRSSSLGLFANKLAFVHGSMGNMEKQKKFLRIAKKLTVRTV